MAIYVKAGDFENPPLGLQPAVLANIFDLEDQPGYQGKGVVHKLVFMFELEARKTKGEWAGKPFLLSKFYTASLGEKSNLRKDLESWRSQPFTQKELEGFDVEVCKGHQCTLNIILDPEKEGKTKIAAICPKMKNQPDIKVETPKDYIPEFIAKMMGHEKQNEATVDKFEDDIPF